MKIKSPFWRGFWSVWMFAGAFVAFAPLWDKEWERPIIDFLKGGRV